MRWKREIYYVYSPLGNPSVKNQRFLPPPFTQGRLWCGATLEAAPKRRWYIYSTAENETNRQFNASGRSTPFGGTAFGLIYSIIILNWIVVLLSFLPANWTHFESLGSILHISSNTYLPCNRMYMIYLLMLFSSKMSNGHDKSVGFFHLPGIHALGLFP